MKNRIIKAVMSAVLGIVLTSCGQVNKPSEKSVEEAVAEARKNVEDLYMVDGKIDIPTMYKNAIDISHTNVYTKYKGRGETEDYTLLTDIRSAQPDSSNKSTKYYVYTYIHEDKRVVNPDLEVDEYASLATRTTVSDLTYEYAGVTKEILPENRLIDDHMDERGMNNLVSGNYEAALSYIGYAEKYLAAENSYTSKGMTNTIDIVFENPVDKKPEPETSSSLSSTTSSSVESSKPESIENNSAGKTYDYDDDYWEYTDEELSAMKAYMDSLSFRYEFVFKRLSKAAYGTTYRLTKYIETEYHATYEETYTWEFRYPTANLATGFITKPYEIPFQDFLS